MSNAGPVLIYVQRLKFNIFSLASGGAIYVRDPHKKLVEEQLNGSEFNEISDEDWDLILAYLEKN